MPRRSRSAIAVAALSLLAACGDASVTASPSALLGTDPKRSDDPTLLACANLLPTVGVLGTIGLDGGVLAGGAARLEVPAGAVLLPTVFQVATPPSKVMEVQLSSIGVEHYVFQKPVSVTIDYSRCAAAAVPAGATLVAVHIAPLSKRILEEMGGTVDPSARTITFTTGHFSSYAVAYRSAPATDEP